MVKKFSLVISLSSFCCAALLGQNECTADFFGYEANYSSFKAPEEQMKIEDNNPGAGKQSEIDQTNRQIEQQNLILEEQRLKSRLGN